MKIYIAYSAVDGGHLPRSVTGYYLSQERAKEAHEEEAGTIEFIDTDDLKNSSVYIDMVEDG